MDNENLILPDASVCINDVECAKCKEYQDESEIYGAFALGLAFIGPIIGILIGLFAGKKLMNK